MDAFAELLDRLVLTPSRNGKIRLLVDYFSSTPDPDRGLALAAGVALGQQGAVAAEAFQPQRPQALGQPRVDEAGLGLAQVDAGVGMRDVDNLLKVLARKRELPVDQVLLPLTRDSCGGRLH